MNDAIENATTGTTEYATWVKIRGGAEAVTRGVTQHRTRSAVENAIRSQVGNARDNSVWVMLHE